MTNQLHKSAVDKNKLHALKHIQPQARAHTHAHAPTHARTHSHIHTLTIYLIAMNEFLRSFNSK